MAGGTFLKCKALPGFFLRIFSSLTSLKNPVFSKRDLLRWKVPGFTGIQGKVLASLSLFLKSEKFPALLYVGKGPKYNPFRDFRPVRAQISNHGRAYSQALLLYENSPTLKPVSTLTKRIILQEQEKLWRTRTREL
jgi:hypothetical protein